jgi:hypothetical protein
MAWLVLMTAEGISPKAMPAKEPRMSDVTMCVMPMQGEGWSVYRVRTASSRYVVGLFRGGRGQRRCAILRGTSRSAGELDVQDSDPRIGDRSLFEVVPAFWPGDSLQIGTACTSRVVSVEEERDPEVVSSITRVGPAPAPPRNSSSEAWSPYPLGEVERVEAVAAVLRRVYLQRTLFDDLAEQPELEERMKLALGESAMVLRALVGRLD